jgi:hypothetical protein
VEINCKVAMPMHSRRRGTLFSLAVIVLLGQSVSAREEILVVRTSSAIVDTLTLVIAQELIEDFTLHQLIVDSTSAGAAIKNTMDTLRPKIVILFDNLPIVLYKAYQRSLPDSLPVVPTVSLLAVNIDRVIRSLKNAVGIRYEIPVVTSTVNMRFLLGVPLENVGVVYRDFMGDVIETNRQYCRKEGINVISYSLPNEKLDYAYALRKGLKSLLADQKVKVLWVVNDNVLLVPALIDNVWAPMARKYGVTVIVGVESLVSPLINFGTYAVLPDHRALGSQVAEMVYRIMDKNWNTDGLKIQPPVSIYDIVNLSQTPKRFPIKDNRLGEIDRVLK